MTHKIAMRRTLADAGVPQPRFAAARDARRAPAPRSTTVGLPAVLKPADSGGQRGVFRVESRRRPRRAPARGARGVADRRGDRRGVPRRHRDERDRDRARRRGDPADALGPAAPARGRLRRRLDPRLSRVDLRRPARGGGARRGARGARARAARRDRVPAADRAGRRVRVVEVAARIPGGQMADLVRHAVGVDLVEVALRQALGEPSPRRARAAAVPAAARDPLPDRRARARCRPGRSTRIGSLEPVLACPGVVQADTYLQVGETIRPVRLDGDRRGYVIAVARHERSRRSSAPRRPRDAARRGGRGA